MKSHILIAAIVASSLLAGCSSKPKGDAGLPPAPPSGDVAQADIGPSGIGNAAVAGSQADLIAKVGTDRVLFDTDSSSLSDEARAILLRQAQWLSDNPSVTFTIEGHCDERGTREYNLALGERRANAVKNFLSAQGVSSQRLRTISYGKERPAEQGSDEESWAQNRRAVSVVAGAAS